MFTLFILRICVFCLIEFKMAATGGILSKIFKSNHLLNSYQRLTVLPLIQTREYAARKGTREKAKKKKVKIEIKKVEFVPHNLRGLDKLKGYGISKKSTDTAMEEPESDNVYISKYYKRPSYSIQEIVGFHAETHHPTMYNEPNAMVFTDIELNMVAEKKTKFVDSFSRTTNLPHPFAHGQERQVMVFCKTPELSKLALESGADLVGGSELIKEIQNGTVSVADFKYVLCHPNIFGELVSIRGLLKRKFPMPKNGTLTSELDMMVTKYKRGLEYRVEQDPNEHDLGLVTVCIGTLEMGAEKLEENFAAIVQDIESVKPRRDGPFVTWAWCRSPPSHERFKVDVERYVVNQSVSDETAEVAQ